MSTDGDATEGTVPVDPPVHVERFPSHASLHWQAGTLEQFLAAVAADPAVPEEPTAVVDATNAAGRQRIPLSDIDTTTGATTHVRVSPPEPWTLAWERRTTPVVTLSGAPAASTCRRLHVGTTDCEGWHRGGAATLARLMGAGR